MNLTPLLLSDTNVTWDYLGSAAVEAMSLETIVFRDTALNTSQSAALAELGLSDEDQWDCWYVQEYRIVPN